MSRSRANPSNRPLSLRTRFLVIGAAVALAGVVGAAENLTSYEVLVDTGGQTEARLPGGSMALMVETRPEVGQVAAYHTSSDDLAADPVESIWDQGTDRYYALDHADRDRPTVVADEQVMGRLATSVPHLGTLWTLPAAVQVTLKVVLVTTYLGVGAYKTGLGRREE